MREISENRLTAPARRLLNSLMNLLQHIKRTHINALTITLQRDTLHGKRNTEAPSRARRRFPEFSI